MGGMEKIKSILLFGAFKTIKSDGISVQYLEVLKKTSKTGRILCYLHRSKKNVFEI